MNGPLPESLTTGDFLIWTWYGVENWMMTHATTWEDAQTAYFDQIANGHSVVIVTQFRRISLHLEAIDVNQ